MIDSSSFQINEAGSLCTKLPIIIIFSQIVSEDVTSSNPMRYIFYIHTDISYLVE